MDLCAIRLSCRRTERRTLFSKSLYPRRLLLPNRAALFLEGVA
jgi:hypothetical protein